ncbi:MAG: transglutaminase family protein [Bradyrhizobiaceae bacterium]|nr:transglutaminase family protein [Bradyrhizobiaceae bacterium]
MPQDETSAFLQSGRFIDSAHPSVIEFARGAIAGSNTAIDRAVALYYAVRDSIPYDMYIDYRDPANFSASGVLSAGRGFCVGKAALLAASCRTVGIPARVGYADVINHISSRRLRELMQTDLFCWHSYAELYIDGRWIKATPAFDQAVCERAGLVPLEFDGQTDSLFHPFDAEGRRRMEYVEWRGAFPDVPFEAILSDFLLLYPKLVSDAPEAEGGFRREAGDFSA